MSAQTRLANLYKSRSEDHNARVVSLSKVITNLQNMLRESNRKQQELLEHVGEQVADISTAGLLNFREEEGSKSQLRALVKYLRQEKDILAGKLEVEEAGSARLKSQLDNLKKDLEEAKNRADKERDEAIMKAAADKSDNTDDDK